jgi:hypothetical protein
MTNAPPAGPDSPPFVQMLRFMRQPAEFLDECGRRHGDAITVRFPSIPACRPGFV